MQVCELMVDEYGLSLEAGSCAGLSALHVAALHDRMEVCQWLLYVLCWGGVSGCLLLCFYDALCADACCG